MGLDIGIITTTVLERPRGLAYRFAFDMCIHAGVAGFMSGEGNSYGWFLKNEVSDMLEDFSERSGLTLAQATEVWAWVESLPWDGDYIELHFNW